MINNTVLVGRLTKDVELKYTQSGVAVANFTLAVERNYTNAQGERETDFINCVLWRKAAENLSNQVVKGSLLGVEGSIQTRTYENNQGATVYVTEINVDNYSLLEPKAVTDERRSTNMSSQQQYGGNTPGGNQNGTMGQYNGAYKSGTSAPRTSNPGAAFNSGYQTGQQAGQQVANSIMGGQQNQFNPGAAEDPFDNTVEIDDSDLPF